MTRLATKVALVTGGGNGIGRAIAVRLASDGAAVVVVDIAEAAAAETTDRISRAGGRAIHVRADITDAADVDHAVTTAIREFGRVDVLCNNAGIMDGMFPVADVPVDLWERVFAVNVTAPFLFSRLVIPGMLERGSGAVINIASVAGLFGGRAGAAYTASKHALVGLTRNIAWTYADVGIRANAICPGGIRTDIGLRDVERHTLGLERYTATQSTMPRSGEPEEIAAVAAFLASDDASLVNGDVIPVDGGWTAA
jgi:NAD(P)-dependent dehydrogenase (short-subunit alcohol dehydrogenase family)